MAVGDPAGTPNVSQVYEFPSTRSSLAKCKFDIVLERQPLSCARMHVQLLSSEPPSSTAAVKLIKMGLKEHRSYVPSKIKSSKSGNMFDKEPMIGG